MRHVSSCLLLVASFLSLPLAVIAQKPASDQDAIHAIVQSESDAWNRADAVAFGAHYAENGIFTNILGQQLYGRPAFIAQHATIFSTIYKGSHNVFNISKITFLRPDVALVEIDGALSGAVQLPPGIKADKDGALQVKLLEVMTRDKGIWSIAAFHNVAVTQLPPGGPPQ